MNKTRRDKVLPSRTVHAETGCGKLYTTCVHKGKQIVEVDLYMGKMGGCSSASLKALSSVISISLQTGASIDHIIDKLSGISCHKPIAERDEHDRVISTNGTIHTNKSCADSVAKSIKYIKKQLDKEV
jgi:hypothetical protein